MTIGSSSTAGTSSAVEELLLPKPPGVFRQFWARHPWLTDSLIAALYLVPMIGVIVGNTLGDGLSPWGIALRSFAALIVTAALLFRRHRPLLTLVVTCLMAIVSFPVYGQADSIPMLFALYAVAVYRSVRAAWIGFGVAVVAAFAGAAISRPGYMTSRIGAEAGAAQVSSTATDWISVGVQYAMLLLLAALIGINIGNRKRYVTALVDRAAQLVRERDQQAQISAAAERARIAREMHDVVAHSLSVVVSLADGAAATTARDPQRARDAMNSVAETGRQALSEMRRLLGVLHEEADGAAPLIPQPGTAQLSELVETFRAAGLEVRFAQRGTAPADDGLQLTVYRMLQESLTNALRYAIPGNPVTVSLSFEDGVELEVLSAAPATPAASTGAGRGVVGIQERAALYGGQASAGRVSGGAWRVHVTIPREDSE